jgi:hypothetical protein
MFSTDNSLTGHGLTLSKVYRSYKNSPHNVDAVYGKYLVHRLENADKYKQSSLEEKFKMDIDFLDHHQRGKAAEKNGHMTTSHLDEFMKNPDTPKLTKQLLNHKKQLSDFIQKEHPEHIVSVNGEPHIRLTRGLGVDRTSRGTDHALASYADIPNTRFGTHMHHQFVPLKNVWFAYDYGPERATSKKFGNENEFVVSPHQNIYNEEHETNPTKPIAVRSHHSLKANNFRFKSFQKKMSQQEVDDFVSKKPELAAEYLKNHPLFNQNHIDTIVEKDPWRAAMYLGNHKFFDANHINSIIGKHAETVAFVKNHPLLNKQHIDTVIKYNPEAAARHLHNHSLFDANHIQTIAEKNPYAAAEYLAHHPLFNEQHFDTIAKHPRVVSLLSSHPIYQAKYGNVQKSLNKSIKPSKQLSNKIRQLLNSKAVLNKTRGTLKFPKILPKDTRPEENVKQIPKDEPEHEMHGGLYTVKPAREQYYQARLKGLPQSQRYAERTAAEQEFGTGGMYLPDQDKAFALMPDFSIKSHEGLHSLVNKASQKLNVKQQDVYNHLNSLIHPEDQEKLKATLTAYGYNPRVHFGEMVPRISDILQNKKVRSEFLNQHYPIDENWNNFDHNTLTTEFHHLNVKAGRQAIQRLGRTWNAIVKMGKDLEKLP